MSAVPRSFDRWPSALSGLGIVLGLVQVVEGIVLYLGWTSVPEGYMIGVLTSVPFMLGLIYSGYWLTRSRLPADQYGRIGHRCLAGLAGFLGINLAIMVAMPPAGPLLFVSWLKWAGALGGSVGLLIGVFEARAINNEVRVERAQIRQEELSRQNERLEEFASIVSHDLRNPLNVAQGRLELAREDAESEHHEPVANALDRMQVLIDDLLSLAREGKVVDEPTTVSLADLGRTSWETVDTKDATLSIETTATIRADERRTRQLLENLFRNAVEHGSTSTPPSDEGAIEHDNDDVSITMGILDDRQGFYVEDDGPGIPDDERNEVFEAGYSTDQDGTGFGLAIVAQTANAHGWDVSVTESETGGARFEFTGADIET